MTHPNPYEEHDRFLTVDEMRYEAQECASCGGALIEERDPENPPISGACVSWTTGSVVLCVLCLSRMAARIDELLGDDDNESAYGTNPMSPKLLR